MRNDYHYPWTFLRSRFRDLAAERRERQDSYCRYLATGHGCPDERPEPPRSSMHWTPGVTSDCLVNGRMRSHP